MAKRIGMGAAVILLSVALVLSACSNSNNDSKDATNKGNSPAPSTAPAASAAPEETTGQQDPLGKYAEPLTVSMVLGSRTPEAKDVPQGLTPDQNGYLKMLKDMTNIDVKYAWTVPYDQFNQKFNLSVASGDLPDVMWLDQVTYEKFKEQGILGDLSQAYDQYASPLLKKYVEYDGGETLNMFKTADGKLLGLPSYSDAFQSMQIVWVRSDWLKKLNLQVPTTFEDMEKVAEAFVKQDPDGNGKDDTYGLAMEKALNYWGFDARGFFNTMGAYPYNFIAGSDGKLVAGETLPETRTALAKLADWYKRGLLDKEWAFKDENKVVEDMVAGKVGLSFGEWWYPNWPLNLVKDKDPNAEWIAFPLPSYEGKPGKSFVPRARLNKILAINKKFEHPDAAIKLANFYPETNLPKYQDTVKTANGYVYEWFEPRMSNPGEMETNYLQVNEALKEKNDKFEFDNGSALLLYEAGKQFLGGDKAGWGLYASRGSEDGGWGLTRKLRDEKLYVRGGYAGPPTPTQVEKGASLTKLTDETFTKIIMGSAPIEDYDKFVDSWKKLGGDDITKEVNDWYTNNPMK